MIKQGMHKSTEDRDREDRTHLGRLRPDDGPWEMTQSGTPIPPDDTAQLVGRSWRFRGEHPGDVSTCFDGSRDELVVLADTQPQTRLPTPQQ